MTDDLVTFLLARIAEDEQQARAVTERQPIDQWDAVGAAGEDDAALSYWKVVGIAHADPTPAARSIAQHIARWDPARVLAEVEAKRAIIDGYEALAQDGQRLYDAKMHLDWNYLRIVLRHLAAPYADHPDYDPTWALTS